MTHTGQCFCGSVTLELTGEPQVMGYCHCSSCRSWAAAPVNAFVLWRPEAVRITGGTEHVAVYQKTPVSERHYCKQCGGHLFNHHPPLGLTDVYAATTPSVEFHPGVHVNYEETKLRLKDGLPKMKDVPAEMGGSGVAVPE